MTHAAFTSNSFADDIAAVVVEFRDLVCEAFAVECQIRRMFEFTATEVLRDGFSDITITLGLHHFAKRIDSTVGVFRVADKKDSHELVTIIGICCRLVEFNAFDWRDDVVFSDDAVDDIESFEQQSATALKRF